MKPGRLLCCCALIALLLAVQVVLHAQDRDPGREGAASDGDDPSGSDPVFAAWSGRSSAIKDRRVVCADNADGWRTLWAEHSDDPRPSVNFSRCRVFAVFAGADANCDLLRALPADRADEGIALRYECIGQRRQGVPGQPWLLWVVERVDAPVTVERVTGAGADRVVTERHRFPAPATTSASRWRAVSVRAGDSLAGLARRHLGDSRHWRVLAAINGIERDLAVGQVLLVPPLSFAERWQPPISVAEASAPPTGVIVVNAGRDRGLARGQVLSLFDEESGQFRAKARVVEVRRNVAVAMIEHPYENVRIKPGDLVRRSDLALEALPAGLVTCPIVAVDAENDAVLINTSGHDPLKSGDLLLVVRHTGGQLRHVARLEVIRVYDHRATCSVVDKSDALRAGDHALAIPLDDE